MNVQSYPSWLSRSDSDIKGHSYAGSTRGGDPSPSFYPFNKNIMSIKVRFKKDYLNFKKGSWHTVTDRFAGMLQKAGTIYTKEEKEEVDSKEDKQAITKKTK